MIRFLDVVKATVFEGLVAGITLGCVHTVILGTGGLYVLAQPMEVAGSLARYAALMGLVGGVIGMATGSALTFETPFKTLLERRYFRPVPVVLAVFYAAPWMAFLTKDKLGPGAVPVVGAVTVLVLVLLLGVTGRHLRRHASTRLVRRPFAPRPFSIVFLLVLWAALLGGSLLVRPAAVAGGADLSLSNPLEKLRNAASSRFARRAGGFPGDRWNVLLLTVDTLRADHLGCYGYDRETSPNIDALARTGVVFTRALCQRPKTSPSFATILTGTYPARHGIHGAMSPLAASNQTLAEHLQGAGWTTAAVITNGNLYPAYGFDQGFDTYTFGHKRAKVGTDLTIGWLEDHATATEPWFLWVHFTDPHTPYSPPPPYDTMFGGGEGPDGGRNPIDLYDGEIRFADNQIRRIMEWLDTSHLRERTLIVFSADHGESLGEHDYYYSHGLHPYEPSARVPLIISAPGVVPPMSTSKALVGGVDILPTILDALWIDVPDIVQGRSFLPAVLGLSDESPQDFVFVEAGYHEHDLFGQTRALRRRSTKYVQRLTSWARRPEGLVAMMWTIDARIEGGLAPDELYDLAADPGETRNLLTERRSLAVSERRLLINFAAVLEASARESLHSPVEIDSATYKSLRSLGYID